MVHLERLVRERLNVVFEGTIDNDSTDNANWKPYVYKGFPVLLIKCRRK